MSRRSTATRLSGLVLVLASCGLPAAAQAEDFFSALFGGNSRPAPVVMPFASEAAPLDMPRVEAPRPRISYGGGQTFCVRTCDGRYFPVTGPDKESRAASCNNFCPASETKLVHGGDIDSAVTDGGKPYSELPNAFRYRTEIVAGCTCNGKDQIGLAPIGIDQDPTLRKGDIVAGADGLVVAKTGANRHAALNFTPAPEAVRAKYRRLPVVASD